MLITFLLTIFILCQRHQLEASSAAWKWRNTPWISDGTGSDARKRNAGISWNKITPAPDLRYSPCGLEGLQCARLELPLDWNATANSSTYGEKYTMAVVRRPARVSVTDRRYGGPILVNPGGPGGSGTSHVFSGEDLQMRFDAAYAYGSDSYVSENPDARYFDLIGFDPRGVAPSTPWHTCYNTVGQFEQYESQTTMTDGVDAVWQRSIEYSKDCVWDPVQNPNGSKIARFASTAMVARDMVELVERHGEWREKQANITDAESVNRLSWRRGEEPIMFAGYSYGTIIGATLAAMQPHRVKRFYLDGVVSPERYYNGDFSVGLASNDRVINDFFASCARAGPAMCSIWDGPSANDTQRRFLHLINQSNGKKSTTFPDLSEGNVTTRFARMTRMLDMLHHNALKSWPEAARRFSAHDASDQIFGGSLQTRAREFQRGYPVNSSTRFDTLDPSMGTELDHEGEYRIMIGAGDSSKRMSKEEYIRGPWKDLLRVAHWVGWDWGLQWQGTFTWPITFGWRFAGTHAVASNVTAHPILFASMLHDGVTSIEGAKEAVSRFKGAHLLVVDGHGHCSDAEPSLCAAKAIRRYFQTGELPSADEHCLPSWQPFNEGRDEDLASLSLEDASMLGPQYVDIVLGSRGS